MNTEVNTQVNTQVNTPTSGKAASAASPTPRVSFQPRVDVYETEAAWILLADLPGVAAEAVKLHTERDTLTLSAVGQALDAAVVGWRREFQLPRGTAVDQIAADLRHGVLTLTLPKGQEIRPRQIPVQSR